MPFIIHAKDSGAPIRGLTAGLLQGMELRRQWDKDELLQKEDARKERLSLLKEQIHEKDLLIKSAAARKAEIENERLEDRAGYAKRRAAHLATLRKGPGLRGKLDAPSENQQSLMAGFVKQGLDIGALDTQFQGVAVHPLVVQAMENAWSETQFQESEWAKLDPTEAAKARKEWYTSTASTVEAVMRRAERQLIDQFFADPMMQPTDDIRTRHLYFDGIKQSNWDHYSETYRGIKADYDSGKLHHAEVLYRLENAEKRLFTDLYQDRKSAEMVKDLEKHGVRQAAQMAKHALDVDDAMMSSAMDVALAEAWEDWEAANKIDGAFNKKADAYLALMEAWNAKSSGLEKNYLQKRRDQMVMGANAEEQQKRYQNTVKYFRDPDMKADYQAMATDLLKQKLEGGKEFDHTMLGDIIAEMEEGKGLMGVDYDVYSDILRDALIELGHTPVGAGAPMGTGGPKPTPLPDDVVVEEGDTPSALAKIRRRAEGLKDYKDAPHASAAMGAAQFGAPLVHDSLVRKASDAWKAAGGKDNLDAATKAWEDAWREEGYDPDTVPKEMLERADEYPFRLFPAYASLAEDLVSTEDPELLDWLVLPVRNDGAGLTKAEAKAFLIRNKDKIRDAIGPYLAENYNRVSGLQDTEWMEVLGPIFVEDANRKAGGKGATPDTKTPDPKTPTPTPDPTSTTPPTTPPTPTPDPVPDSKPAVDPEAEAEKAERMANVEAIEARHRSEWQSFAKKIGHSEQGENESDSDFAQRVSSFVWDDYPGRKPSEIDALSLVGEYTSGGIKAVEEYLRMLIPFEQERLAPIVEHFKEKVKGL